MYDFENLVTITAKIFTALFFIIAPILFSYITYLVIFTNKIIVEEKRAEMTYQDYTYLTKNNYQDVEESCQSAGGAMGWRSIYKDGGEIEKKAYCFIHGKYYYYDFDRSYF